MQTQNELDRIERAWESRWEDEYQEYLESQDEDDEEEEENEGGDEEE